MTFGLLPVEGHAGTFDFPIAQAWCSETHLFGGASFGATVEALEASAGKPLLSASVQFLERGKLDTRLRIETQLLAGSRSVAQARAEALCEGRRVVTAAATLGVMPASPTTTATMPEVADPRGLAVRKYLRALPGSISDTQDVRPAGVDGQRVNIWMRYARESGGPLSAGILALLSDQVSAATGFVMGLEKWWGLTLDGTLRIATAFESRGANDWVLLAIRFDVLNESFGHGTIEMWSEDRTLLAVAAQSIKPRRW
jgi:acyl-CoA thioesterase